MISRPIVRVKNLLSALAQGDLSVQLNDTKNKDELGILQNSAVSLNRMLSDMLTQSGMFFQRWQHMTLHPRI